MAKQSGRNVAVKFMGTVNRHGAHGASELTKANVFALILPANYGRLLPMKKVLSKAEVVRRIEKASEAEELFTGVRGKGMRHSIAPGECCQNSRPPRVRGKSGQDRFRS